MKSNIEKIYYLRNGKIFENHEKALLNINNHSSKLSDGEAVLVRYYDNINEVRTLICYKYEGDNDESLTIVDTEAIENAISSVSSDLSSHASNETIHVSVDEKNTWNAKAEVSQIPDVSNYIDGVEYESDGINHSIVFYHGNTYIDSIDADPFLVDGMIEDVRIEGENLVIDFNTASGKQDIYIPLVDIFDSKAYYTKEEVEK